MSSQISSDNRPKSHRVACAQTLLMLRRSKGKASASHPVDIRIYSGLQGESLNGPRFEIDRLDSLFTIVDLGSFCWLAFWLYLHTAAGIQFPCSKHDKNDKS